MFIVNDTRDRIVNVANVTDIGLEDNGSIIAYVHGDNIVLGKYTHERAKEVFGEMLKEVFPPVAVVFKNCEPTEECLKSLMSGSVNAVMVRDMTGYADVSRFDCGVYYMPEE